MEKLLCLLLALLVIISCSGKKSSYGNMQKKGLAIYLNEINNDSVPDELYYRLQVIPDKKILLDQLADTKNDLIFHMDSLIYVRQGNLKIYPIAIQRIANGNNSIYEYMVVFNKVEFVLPDTLEMTFKDKFFTKQEYTINLYQQ